MAVKKNTGKIGKVSFGKRKVGVHKKHKGPKEKHIKEYQGQGR